MEVRKRKRGERQVDFRIERIGKCKGEKENIRKKGEYQFMAMSKRKREKRNRLSSELR